MCNTTDLWPAEEIRHLPLECLDERYARYRLPSAELDQAMVRSLRDYGQLSPIVVCRREEAPVLIDGFKRLRASRRIEGMTTLFARRIDANEATAKAAIYGLNQIGRRPCELEEAWIVHSLVREDGLSQLQVAKMLGRHKSWVCRRLALLEKLIEEARDDLRLGLLSVSAARQLIRLPAGNQAELMAAMRRRSLSATELEGVTDLLLASATVQQKQFILGDPRKALRQAKGPWTTSWDPRLSVSGNRVSKQLGVLDYATYTIDFTEEGPRRVQLFSYILGYSRRQYIRFVERQDFATTIRQHVRAFEHLGGVAATCLYDNMKVVVPPRGPGGGVGTRCPPRCLFLDRRGADSGHSGNATNRIGPPGRTGTRTSSLADERPSHATPRYGGISTSSRRTNIQRNA